jgi:hypothetical protein
MTVRLIRALPVAALLTAGLALPAAAAVINGTGGADVLVGTSRADTIHGYRGNDILRGKVGADHLYGGRGADRLYPGDDAQTDVLRGGPGADTISARVGPHGRGADRVYAGGGNDIVKLVEMFGWYTAYVDCGPGKDTLMVEYRSMIPSTGCERVVLLK